MFILLGKPFLYIKQMFLYLQIQDFSMIFDRLSGVFVNIISSLGYPGVFFLMMLESMVFPVPSELVMPFAGFLVADGKMSLWFAIIASSIGSITGSLISYYMAYFGGAPFISKFGRFVFLDREELGWTQRWFQKRGSWTILFSRFIPVVRHLISIPAGLGRMKLWKFIVATLIGATIWNSFLLWVGIKLRERWELVHQYSSQLDYLVIGLIVLALVYYIYKHLKHRHNA
jgi:membrane protein DedA with SNARE-associated domain